jgi:hypothetical protein
VVLNRMEEVTIAVAENVISPVLVLPSSKDSASALKVSIVWSPPGLYGNGS